MAKKKKLDFIIVGSAKCGTTSVSEYMKEHPDICMPEIKDLRLKFLDYPIDKVAKYYYANIIETVDDYFELFAGCPDEKVIGETNIHYIYLHEKSIPFIKKYHGDPKIIIMLRNPIKRAYSSYTMMKRDMREKLPFYEALQEEDKRIDEGSVLIWHYKNLGLFYEQVKAYKDNFSNVRVIILDDLAKDPEGTMKELFEFVEVDPGFVPDLSKRHNISGVPKNKALQQFYVFANFVKQTVYPARVRESKGIKKASSIVPDSIKELPQKIYRKNLEKDGDIDEKSLKYLRSFFHDDVKKLSTLLDRDLMPWLSGDGKL